MSVTSRLTWMEEQRLGQLLGNASLTLLYKSSVHSLNPFDVATRCAHEGPTMTVLHFQEAIVGVFMLEKFPSLSFKNSSTCVRFLINKNKEAEISTLLLNAVVEFNKEQLEFCSSSGWSLSVDPSKNKFNLHDSLIDRLGFHFNTYLECEIFRVDGIKSDPGFIKKMVTVKQYRRNVQAALKDYRPKANSVSKVRILLVGPVSSGKSSFFNSVKSVFQGHVTRQAMVGSDESSITQQYRTYYVKDGKDGNDLPFILCDSMGLDEREEAGLCLDDIPHILKGCVPDRYQFNPSKPFEQQGFIFITPPPLKDRIHCVAYVLDFNSVNTLSDKMLAKLKHIHREVLDYGVGHVVLLTKVNNWDEILDDNFLNMTEHMTSQSQVVNIHKMLNIPLSKILMVDNYASKRKLDPMKDVLILSVLRQMLWAADDALEDLPSEKAASGDMFFNNQSPIKPTVQPSEVKNRTLKKAHYKQYNHRQSIF